MDPIRRFRRPALRAPRALLAWEGWNDACDAASGATSFIVGQHDAEPFAVLEPEEFFDFQERRPTVEYDDGGTRRLMWPDTRFYAIERATDAHDLVVGLGEEPALRWKTYARSIARLLAESDVELAVTLGAYIGEVAHTVPVPVTGVATDPALVDGFQLDRSHYEGPTGIVGVTMEAFREVGIPAVSLWAATPHYLAANPNPKAMLALLQRAGPILGLALELGELEQAAAEFDERVDEAMAENEEFVDYVKRLEQESGAPHIDPTEAPSLISEIEQFLRDR
ncbi:MAG TPA: PAC2 family protein [Acidimicrobiia bacterium]|nr:PAC2 family protein [Acidimicrobiia bacterium]